VGGSGLGALYKFTPMMEIIIVVTLPSMMAGEELSRRAAHPHSS